jgi:hypothetical protein
MKTWYVSFFGSDSNNGISPATAFQTISKAISTSNPGDTINVASGDYSGASNTNLQITGDSQNPLTFICDDGYANIYLYQNNKYDTIFSGGYGIFKNFGFSGSTSDDNVSINLITNGNNITLDSCLFTGTFLITNSNSCQVLNTINANFIINSSLNCSISDSSGSVTVKNDDKIDENQFSCKLKQFMGSVDISDSYCNIIYSNITKLNMAYSIGTIINQCLFTGPITHKESSETLIIQNRFVSSNTNIYITISDSINYTNNVHIVNNLFSNGIAVKYNGSKGVTNIAVNYNNIIVDKKMESILIDFSESTNSSSGMVWNNIVTRNGKINVGKSMITEKTNSLDLYEKLPKNNDPSSFYISSNSLVGTATFDNLTNSDYYGKSHPTPPDIGVFNQM